MSKEYMKKKIITNTTILCWAKHLLNNTLVYHLLK